MSVDLQSFVDEAVLGARKRTLEDLFHADKEAQAKELQREFSKALFGPYHGMSIRRYRDTSEPLTAATSDLYASLNTTLETRTMQWTLSVRWVRTERQFHLAVKERNKEYRAEHTWETAGCDPHVAIEKLAKDLATRMAELLVVDGKES